MDSLWLIKHLASEGRGICIVGDEELQRYIAEDAGTSEGVKKGWEKRKVNGGGAGGTSSVSSEKNEMEQKKIDKADAELKPDEGPGDYEELKKKEHEAGEKYVNAEKGLGSKKEYDQKTALRKYLRGKYMEAQGDVNSHPEHKRREAEWEKTAEGSKFMKKMTEEAYAE